MCGVQLSLSIRSQLERGHLATGHHYETLASGWPGSSTMVRAGPSDDESRLRRAPTISLTRRCNCAITRRTGSMLVSHIGRHSAGTIGTTKSGPVIGELMVRTPARWMSASAVSRSRQSIVVVRRLCSGIWLAGGDEDGDGYGKARCSPPPPPPPPPSGGPISSLEDCASCSADLAPLYITRLASQYWHSLEYSRPPSEGSNMSSEKQPVIWLDNWPSSRQQALAFGQRLSRSGTF